MVSLKKVVKKFVLNLSLVIEFTFIAFNHCTGSTKWCKWSFFKVTRTYILQSPTYLGNQLASQVQGLRYSFLRIILDEIEYHPKQLSKSNFGELSKETVGSQASLLLASTTTPGRKRVEKTIENVNSFNLVKCNNVI